MGMRSLTVLFWCVVCSIISFVVGVAVERHRSGDELNEIRTDTLRLENNLIKTEVRLWRLEAEASEVKVRAQAFESHVDHL